MKHCSTSSQSSQAPVRRVVSYPGLQEYRYWLDDAGRQHFNFRQSIWLQPRLTMAVTPVITIALETLAVNLLGMALPDAHTPRGAVGDRGAPARELARRFCEQCLLTAGADGWVIPRASVRAWAAAQRRRGRPL